MVQQREVPISQAELGARFSRWYSLALLGPVLLLAGCGGGKGDVSGDVTFDGKLLSAGRVTFQSQVGEKKTVSAPIRRGKYTIKDCPAGPVKIGVESYPPRNTNYKGMPADMAKTFKPPEGEEPEPNAPPLPHVPIPPRFVSPDDSGLEYTVQRGSQTHNLMLKP